jgi:hypothetical protein
MSIRGGFTKLLKGENTQLSKERLKICHKCDERAGILCGICGCWLKAKTRDESEKCPLKKW